MSKNIIFLLEGTDASGKETQTIKLYDRLTAKGIPCEQMDFPQYNSPTGDIVKRYLGKEPYAQEFGPATDLDPKIASVFFAVDRLFHKSKIEQIINSGKHLILNRYVESNMGHQGGKIKDSKIREDLFNWIVDLEYTKNKMPRPDKVLFLYMPYQVGMELKKGRPGKADGHEASPEHLKNAEEAYLQLCDKLGWSKINCAPDGTLASLKSKDEIADLVYREFINTIEK